MTNNLIRTLIDFLNYHTRLYNDGKPEISDQEWDNKYTFIYQDNDISEDPDSFGSNLYELYYGLDEIVGIPWEEWENTK